MNCIICNGSVEVLINGPIGDICRCRSCELRLVNPIPSDGEITEYYKGLYKAEATVLDLNRLNSSIETVRQYSKTVKELRNSPIRVMMDYGGGLGYYCKAGETLGIEVTLADPDPISISFATNELQLENVHLIAPAATFNLNKKFDFILLRHVIEHVKDPTALLENCKNHLTSDGIIWIETDNNASIELMLISDVRKFYRRLYEKNYNVKSLVELMRKKPFAVDSPRHLFGFRISNLALLLGNLKCEVIYAKSYMLGDMFFWPNVRLTDPKILARLLITMKFRRVLEVILDYLLLPIRKLLNHYDKGAGIQIVVMAKH